MSNSIISGNMIGSYSQLGKTFTIVDENGVEVTGVIVDQEVIFDATDNDVREGFVYASDSGVSIGTKIIPIYYARYGCKIAQANTNVVIDVPEYDYDSFIVVISTFNKNISNSITSTFNSIDDSVYAVGSNVKVSDILIDVENEQIDLGLTVTEKSVVRYFVIIEEY